MATILLCNLILFDHSQIFFWAQRWTRNKRVMFYKNDKLNKKDMEEELIDLETLNVLMEYNAIKERLRILKEYYGLEIDKGEIWFDKSKSHSEKELVEITKIAELKSELEQYLLSRFSERNVPIILKLQNNRFISLRINEKEIKGHPLNKTKIIEHNIFID